MNDKKFKVENVEERWYYDTDVPRREIAEYWVTFGKEVIKKFAYRKDAEEYADKLNNKNKK